MTPSEPDSVTPVELTERAAALKERVYVTFTALVVALALGAYPDDTSPSRAATTLLVTVGGTLLAVLLADFISHIAVHAALPTREELARMVRVTSGALVTVVLPLALVGLAGLGVMTIEVALRLSVVALLGSLVVISYIAVRRVPMAFWKRAIVLLAEVVLGAGVIGLELLAHG